MLNEPSAAGFEYTHRHRDTLSSRRDLVVVYDLGGGTFDASRRAHERQAPRGPRHRGLRAARAATTSTLCSRTLVLARRGLSLGGAPRARRARACSTNAAWPRRRWVPASRKVTLDLEAALGEDAPQPEVTLPVTDYYEACAPLVETHRSRPWSR